MRFVHFTYPYAHYSAGIRVIHRYCHLMRKAGYDAYITSGGGNPEWDTPVATGPLRPDDIVIYPECIRNTNPLGARNIVRYMLYFPTAYWGGSIIPATEYCIPYDEYLYEETVRHYAGQLTRDDILCIPCLEPGLFKPAGPKTIAAAYYIGKGAVNYPSPYLPAGATEITRQWPPTRPELARLLQSVTTFYCADHNTALLTEARACGCDVWLLNGQKPLSRSQYNGAVMDDVADAMMVDKTAKKIINFFSRGTICK